MNEIFDLMYLRPNIFAFKQKIFKIFLNIGNVMKRYEKIHLARKDGTYSGSSETDIVKI